MKLHEHKNKYDSQFPFLNWFFVIIRNVIIDDVRKNKIKIYELTDNIPSPELAITPDITKHILSAPENYQEALKLRYIEDQDFSEIAKKLNTSEANVRKKISRGIEYLRQKFKGESL
jgi:RNA polymerase sigma-70 factor (ECF subfamily)